MFCFCVFLIFKFQLIIMKKLIFALLICLMATGGFAQSANEKLVRTYYSGFANHNWNLIAGQLAAGFTFTSANNDDHISLAKFKEKCWPTNRFFKSVKFVKMTENGNDLFLLVEITTTDNKIVRNVDLYHFEAGKIKSIETFFGKGESYPGNKK